MLEVGGLGVWEGVPIFSSMHMFILSCIVHIAQVVCVYICECISSGFWFVLSLEVCLEVFSVIISCGKSHGFSKEKEPTSMIIHLGLYEFVGILTLDVGHCRGCDTHSH